MVYKLKNKWKTILICFLLLTCVIFFDGCSCSKNNTTNNNTNKMTYTVMFYTGSLEKYDLPEQEVEEGQLVEEPRNFPTRYYDPDGTEYLFIGWYRDISLDEQYVWKFATDKVFGDMQLYAKWQEIEK